MADHINAIHLGLRPFKCETCGQGFTQSSHVKSHYKRVHLKVKNHKCEHCDKSFNAKQELKRHVLTIHDENGPDTLKCEQCDFVTKSFQGLRFHSYRHGKPKPYPCDECDKAYETTDRLNLHKINLHTEMKPFPCSFCTVGFSSKNGLHYHLKGKHPEKSEQPIEWNNCDICEYKSIHIELLRHHKRSHDVNNQYKQTTCSICSLKLNKSSLNTHMKLIHGNTEKLNCGDCDFATHVSKDLQRHVDAIHKGIRQECDQCDKSFAAKGGLARHIKKVHQLSCRENFDEMEQ